MTSEERFNRKSELQLWRFRGRAFAAVLGMVLIVFGFASVGCRPARPSNVPLDSAYVFGAKAGWWQHCSYDPKQDSDHCQIFNMGGEVLADEVFLPYDGGRAAKESELSVVTDSNLTGPNYICLKNGRILIPKSHFEQEKHFIDWRTGKSKTL
jgi:hypothetical protein